MRSTCEGGQLSCETKHTPGKEVEGQSPRGWRGKDTGTTSRSSNSSGANPLQLALSLPADIEVARIQIHKRKRSGKSINYILPPGTSAKLSIRILLCDGYLRSQASPKKLKSLITYHVMSTCHHFRPCRQDIAKAWWLLCQPSP